MPCVGWLSNLGAPSLSPSAARRYQSRAEIGRHSSLCDNHRDCCFRATDSRSRRRSHSLLHSTPPSLTATVALAITNLRPSLRPCVTLSHHSNSFSSTRHFQECHQADSNSLNPTVPDG